jgi:hypothetical protein
MLDHVIGRIPVDQMRRGELAHASDSVPQKGRRMMADGTFAVGASDVNCPPRELDILEQLADAL